MALMTNAQRKRANKIRGIVSVVATVGFVATTIGFVGCLKITTSQRERFIYLT